MLYALIITILLFIAAFLFMKSERFGALPSNEQKEQIRRSPHFNGKSFTNINDTPSLSEDASFVGVLYDFLFRRGKRIAPKDILPTIQTNLLQLPRDKNVLIWFGHSSYFMQVDGLRILVDPVLSGHASPLRFTTKSFKGVDIYTPDDFPSIDYLFITHDHWDHLDYKTVKALRPKVKKVICGLGVPAHLLRWGYDRDLIIEKDWNEQVLLEDGFTVHTTSGRHFSGRGFKRNQTLWMSYVLQTPTKKIFIGGDSGYDTHFAEIGKAFGPFDWAILECGQYDADWKYIHMMPGEVVQAAIDLNTKQLIPVHWGKFSLSKHDWDAPIIEVSKQAALHNIPIKTPQIGEILDLDHTEQLTRTWWTNLK
jgi:L-ascorbate metabolism protein UlaG (beta-lactamase superfamily)